MDTLNGGNFSKEKNVFRYTQPSNTGQNEWEYVWIGKMKWEVLNIWFGAFKSVINMEATKPIVQLRK